jgi:hypothetical protein
MMLIYKHSEYTLHRIHNQQALFQRAVVLVTHPVAISEKQASIGRPPFSRRSFQVEKFECQTRRKLFPRASVAHRPHDASASRRSAIVGARTDYKE